MLTAPTGKNTTEEDPAPPQRNHSQPPAGATIPLTAFLRLSGSRLA